MMVVFKSPPDPLFEKEEEVPSFSKKGFRDDFNS
jgi:hypothetical protein